MNMQEYRDYLRLYPDADGLEKAEVRSWMMKGYSPYENGSGICDDKGRMMDYIAAMRFEDEMYKAYKENPEQFLKNMASTNCRETGAPDLPF